MNRLKLEAYKWFISCLIVSLNFTSLCAQTTNYYLDGGSIKTKNFSKITNAIQLDTYKIKSREAITAAIISTLVPIVVKKVPKLFYKPERYIKEYTASYSFVSKKGELQSFKDVEQIQFLKTGTNVSGNEERIASLIFHIDDIPSHLGFKTITLESFDFNYSPVKLKSQHNKINVVIELSLTYFDEQNKLQEFILTPFKINEITPKSSKVLEKKSLQILPPMKVIENLAIKITEVNSRKKDWDKWLELYNKNQDKITEYLLEVVSK